MSRERAQQMFLPYLNKELEESYLLGFTYLTIILLHLQKGRLSRQYVHHLVVDVELDKQDILQEKRVERERTQQNSQPRSSNIVLAPLRQALG